MKTVAKFLWLMVLVSPLLVWLCIGFIVLAPERKEHYD